VRYCSRVFGRRITESLGLSRIIVCDKLTEIIVECKSRSSALEIGTKIYFQLIKNRITNGSLRLIHSPQCVGTSRVRYLDLPGRCQFTGMLRSTCYKDAFVQPETKRGCAVVLENTVNAVLYKVVATGRVSQFRSPLFLAEYEQRKTAPL